MVKIYCIVTVLILLALKLNAQTPRIDSLRKELVKDKDDSIKVHDRIRISWYLVEQKDSAAAWKYIHEADSIADKTANPVLKGIVYEHMGFLYNRQFSRKAITYYLQAEHILKQHPNSVAAQKSMASLNLNLGIEHMNISDDAGALVYYFESIRRYEAMDSMHGNLPILYANVINSYYNMGKYETALTYCEKAYAKSFSRGNAPAMMSACINYGRVLYKLNQEAKANRYFNQGKAIADSIGDYYFQGKYYAVLGANKFEEKKYSESLTYFTKAHPVLLLTQAPYDIASNYIWLGASNAALKNYEVAKKYLDTALSISTTNDYAHLVKDVYLNRYHMEKIHGNYAAAIAAFDSFNVLRDSIQHIADADRIEFLDAKYQADKKETQIGLLQSETLVQQLSIRQKNTLNYILGGSAAAILIISLFSYRAFKQRQRMQQQLIEKLETEKQLTATEAVLKGEEQERSRLAKDLHDGLGGMMSGIKYTLLTMKKNQIMTPENQQAFEHSIALLDSSINEMRRVAHNMMPEALVKFGLDVALSDFCNEVEETGALQVSYQSIGIKEAQFDQTTAITIYRIVQELINNTLKHADAKKAIVQVTKTDGLVSITVEDDGKGFNTAILEGVKGIGWTNIQSRVDYLKGKLDVRSGAGKGTSVHIELNT